MADSNKFEIQENLYEFPYHYIPHFESDGTPSLVRRLNWGFDYLCYQKHLFEKVVAMQPQSVLEVGCGDGYFLGNLPKSIPVRIGVDLSSKAIAFAKAFNPHCTFYSQNAADLKETFDIVAAIEVLEHIPDESVSEFLNVLSSKVNDEGKVVISVPTVVTPLNKKHYRHYTVDLLERQLRESNTGLIIEDFEYIYAKPWWFWLFTRFFNNRMFSFEFKPFMRYAWNSVWNKYRLATSESGYHLIAILKNNVGSKK